MPSNSSDAPAIDIQEMDKLFELATDAQITSLITIGFFALLIYDHIMTIDNEVALIWKIRRPSVAKYIYIWNRYFSLVALGVCASVYVQQIDSDALYVPRAPSTVPVWILFSKSWKLLSFMIPAILIEAAVMLLVGELTTQAAPTNVHSRLVNGCYSTSPLPWYFPLFAVPSLVVGFIMFVLTAYRCCSKLGLSFSNIMDVRRSWMPIATLFLRDGVFGFWPLLVTVNPVQIVLWMVAPVALSEILFVPSTIVYSIIGSRSLLNLLDIAHGSVSPLANVPSAPAIALPLSVSVSRSVSVSGRPTSPVYNTYTYTRSNSAASHGGHGEVYPLRALGGGSGGFNQDQDSEMEWNPEDSFAPAGIRMGRGGGGKVMDF
ncbi:hypothetical protein C8F01DRAFT_1348897 [Mycena amicta]|nr:hypothetical protein C8F01DRAFT_1348897 [Mycena amicta]